MDEIRVKTASIAMMAITLAFMLMNLVSCRRSKQEAELESQKNAEIEEAVAAMVAKHGAVDDWEKPIGKRSVWDKVYTIELERALVRADKRPVLWFGSVDDVELNRLVE